MPIEVILGFHYLVFASESVSHMFDHGEHAVNENRWLFFELTLLTSQKPNGTHIVVTGLHNVTHPSRPFCNLHISFYYTRRITAKWYFDRIRR
jgi:hypothetical protein